MVRQVSSKHQWSNRVQIKMIRLARTISDLEGSRRITDESIWKAITLRRESASKDGLRLKTDQQNLMKCGEEDAPGSKSKK